jgi:hypothetical protein
MTVFFVTGYALATLLFFVWLIWQGGLIEPSAAGFIE